MAKTSLWLQTLLSRESEREGRGEGKEDKAKRKVSWTRGTLKNSEVGEGYCGRRERNRQCGWIVASCNRLGLQMDSTSLAISIFDHVISQKDVLNKYANCAAAASLYIAKKICEDGDDSQCAYLKSLDLAYSERELHRMELTVLAILDWDALLPTVERFACAQLKVIRWDVLVPALKMPLQEILVDGGITCSIRPSLLALAVVSLLLETVFKNARWIQLIQPIMTLQRVDMSSLISTRESVSRLLTRNTPSYVQYLFYYSNPFAPLTPDDSSEDDLSDINCSSVGDESDPGVMITSPSRLQPAMC